MKESGQISVNKPASAPPNWWAFYAISNIYIYIRYIYQFTKSTLTPGYVRIIFLFYISFFRCGNYNYDKSIHFDLNIISTFFLLKYCLFPIFKILQKWQKYFFIFEFRKCSHRALFVSNFFSPFFRPALEPIEKEKRNSGG